MSIKPWDARFMSLARHIASWSKDRSTQVGAIIVGPHREIRSTGYNGMPPGLDDTVEERHLRPAKYMYFEHAERNALYFAAMNGVRIEGCTLYVTLAPCVDCARGVIRSGLARVVCPTLPGPGPAGFVAGDWREGCRIAHEILEEAGVVVDFAEAPVSRPT